MTNSFCAVYRATRAPVATLTKAKELSKKIIQLPSSAQKNNVRTSAMHAVLLKTRPCSIMANSTVHTNVRLTKFVWHACNWDIRREM